MIFFCVESHNRSAKMKVMRTFPIVIFLTVSAAASSQRSSGSCIGSLSSGPVTQTCGTERFFCPVDSMCKPRDVRCTGTTECIESASEERGCDAASNTAYTIKLARTSLLGRKRLEFNHQLISYRGFVYEYGCNYGVQILDLNDPKYKYNGINLDFENVGTSSCTYEQVLPFINSWERKYNVLTHNCQHFAMKLSDYLQTAQCSGSRKRNTDELASFADNLVANCKECCEAVDAEDTAVYVMASNTILLLPLLPLLIL